ncbi:MAG: cyclic pyranopterin monophosphate synthase MoaC [Acidobacteriota bacterium]
MPEFTHIDDLGRARMVDVTGKPVTSRTASAAAVVRTTTEVVAAIREQRIAKGPVLETARIAGIQAAKRTADLIPLCHPLPVHHVDVECELGDNEIRIISTVRTEARTGVEMEALCAAAVAALTVYDMCKAADRSMTIAEIRLIEKTGGKSGDYFRQDSVGR